MQIMLQRQLITQFLSHTKFSTSSPCCKIKYNIITKARGSSADWLKRHLSDPYVKKTRIKNYRARSAFKLIEINEKYKFLLPGKVVLECGAAPGAWTQVVVELVKPEENLSGLIIANDILNFFPVEGATILPFHDFTIENTRVKICELLGDRKIDVFLSDMCPNISGINSLDHIRIMDLVNLFYQFAIKHSAADGCLLCKLREGAYIQSFVKEVSTHYRQVKIVKPPASRSDSSEMFMYASKFISET